MECPNKGEVRVVFSANGNCSCTNRDCRLNNNKMLRWVAEEKGTFRACGPHMETKKGTADEFVERVISGIK